MSQENVEIVRAILDALNEGDPDSALKYTAPGFEYDFSRSITKSARRPSKPLGCGSRRSEPGVAVLFRRLAAVALGAQPPQSVKRIGP